MITFSIVLFFSIKYSDKTLKFRKNKDEEIFVGLGWHAFTYYLMAIVGRIIVLSIVTIYRLHISNILNYELEGVRSPIYYNLSIITIITIFLNSCWWLENG
jgi:hypothetical protein